MRTLTLKMTIYRYNLPAIYNKVVMPKGADILQAMYQPARKSPSIWALIDREEKDTTERCFVVTGTGHSFPHYSELVEHWGSFVMPDGFHVFHVFEVECIATEENQEEKEN